MIISFIFLSTLLSIICVYNSTKFFEKILIFALFLVLLCFFWSQNIFNFYISFELSLPIIFLMIAIYGSNFRIKAAYYIFIYTLTGSLSLLVGFLLYYLFTNNIYFYVTNYDEISNNLIENVIYLFILLSFLVKLPQFPFHIWLTYAHTEAPASGSVLLAGVILKLSVFGIITILLNLLPNAHDEFTPYIKIIAIVTLFYSTFITLILNDTKSIVAYSSIAHMSIIILGIYSNSIIGLIGSIILSLAHGFVSPALFLLVGDYIYKIYHTRNISEIKGLLVNLPLITIFLFVFSLANISFPFTMNFFGEFLCLSSLKNNLWILTLSSFTILLSSVITFNLLTKLINRDSLLIYSLYFITRVQFWSLIVLVVLTVYFGVNSKLFFSLGYLLQGCIL